MRLLFELLLFFVLLFFFGGLCLIFYRWLSKRFFKSEEPPRLKEEKPEILQAEQNALREKNNLDKVKYEAQQKVVSAEATAKAIKIQAEAITQQGGREYVNLKAVEKWDGKLPEQMIPNSTLPFINLSTPASAAQKK